ncbi:MAG: hypothetical protein J2P21_25900, partial [Chloracidobacterium sp.]|nr:hypothetical protein [Chloracidobacterium sp.]
NWRGIRWCHDPDNVVLKHQELSRVEGFSLMSGPGGANHQLRRAFNRTTAYAGVLLCKNFPHMTRTPSIINETEIQ